MNKIKVLMEDSTNQLERILRDALEAQRTALAGVPEREIRAMGVEQMAEFYEQQAVQWYGAAEVYEAQECEAFALRSREFAKIIREGN